MDNEYIDAANGLRKLRIKGCIIAICLGDSFFLDRVEELLRTAGVSHSQCAAKDSNSESAQLPQSPTRNPPASPS